MAKVGYVLIEHFAAAVEQRRQPELAGRPVVIGGYPHERKVVYAASAEATALGIKPGLALRQAEQLCPSAVFLPLAESCYEETVAAFLAIVESFSPTVAPDAPGSAYFDACGLERLFGADETLAGRIAGAIRRQVGLAPCVGFGPTRFTARIAAQLSQPGAFLIAADTPAAFLADLPVDYLPEAAVLSDQLSLLGIRTIGQFMRLPSSEIMEQFGPAGVAAYQAAHGYADPPLLPRPRPAAFQRRKEFEPPLVNLTALAAIVGRLGDALAGALQQRYQACQTVILRLELAGASPFEGVTQLKEPAAQASAIAAAALRIGERMERLSIAPTCRSAGACPPPVPASATHNEPPYGLPRYGTGALGQEPGPGDPESESTTLQIKAIQIVVTGLVAQGGQQLGLFDAQRLRRAHLQRAAAEIRRRFGDRLKRAEYAPKAGNTGGQPFVMRDYL